MGASKVVFVFRSPAANTLQVTLVADAVQPPEVAQTWIGQALATPAEDAASVPPVPAQAPGVDAGGPGEPVQFEADKGLYEGTVRLNVQAKGNMGPVVAFTQRLREMPEFRLLRLANNNSGGVDIWLALREPLDLRRMLDEMECVAHVSPTRERDLSPGSADSPLTVLLKVQHPRSGPCSDMSSE